MDGHLIEGNIGWAHMPGRGTTHFFKVAGHDVQIYVTEKQQRIRVWVDHVEWKAGEA